MVWPMHCHLETSQTAAGGNYPNGLISHMKLLGPVNPANEVIIVEKAEIRMRFGRLSLAGRASGGSLLTIYAGAPGDGRVIGTVTVPVNGRWGFEGRGLKALSIRTVSMVSSSTATRENIRCTVR